MKNLAEFYHKGQFRKGEGNIPYIVHPQSVAELLLKWGENPQSPAIATAWGHDLLEDTQVSEAEILAVSDNNVLNNIKLLTRPRSMNKAWYLQQIAESGSREALLVKISDRICNSRDFIALKGELYAFQYLHEADCLLEALKLLAADGVVENALAEWNALDKVLEKPARRAAVRGCLLGGAVGDALGAPVEFMCKSEIIRKHGAAGVIDYVEYPGNIGSITDDTQMTLFTAEGMLRAYVRGHEKGICSTVGVMHIAYLRWLKTQGFNVNYPEEYLNSGWLILQRQLHKQRAPGMTCISALEKITNSHKAANDSTGCGTVMRMAPAGLFGAPERAYRDGCDFSAITHGHPTGIIAGGAFAMLTAYLMEGKSLERSLDLVEDYLQNVPAAGETLRAIRHARTAKSIEELGEGWVAEEALAIGIYCALQHTWDFQTGVLMAVNISGDSDSTGAIAGNILGLLNGENAIPRQWLANLREYEIVSQVAEDVYKGFEAGDNGHVTESWWAKYPGY